MDVVGAATLATPRCPGLPPWYPLYTRLGGIVQALLVGGESQESQSTCSRLMFFPSARADPAFLAVCHSPSTGEGEVKPADSAGEMGKLKGTQPLCRSSQRDDTL